MSKEYKVIGIMSGSSLDGLDISYARYWQEEDSEKWNFEFIKTELMPYPRKWQLRLGNLAYQDAITYLKTSAYYGLFIGEQVREFILKHNIDKKEVDFIASHGHTVFHQPENHVSSQVGDGAKIAAISGIPTISNFRDTDVALGGQGAPISPVGDKLLFPEFPLALNLGGFANISAQLSDGRLIGFDIVPVNVIINQIAKELGYDMDKDGSLAREGSVNEELLETLNGIWYYDKPFPKCLSLGWVNRVLKPIFKKSKVNKIDLLRTYYEHVAVQIGNALKKINEIGLAEGKERRMLVTGGGAFNEFLLERIREYVDVEMVIPDDELVKFKEALIIGLLGVLRMEGKPNVYASVTGSDKDTINGALYLPPPEEK